MSIEAIDLRSFKGTGNLEAKGVEIQRRKQHLLSLGFSVEWLSSFAEHRPALIDPVTADERLDLLKNLGFENPIKLVTTHPEIFALAEDNIRGKIDLLKNLGFENPIKMVTTHPAIFALAEDNIRKRIRLFTRLTRKYDLSLNPISMMEKEFGLFSTKLDKIWTLARIIRAHQPLPQDITQSLVSTLVRKNLEDVLVTFSQTNTKEESIAGFVRRVKKTKDSELPLDEKIDIIELKLDNSSKVKRRYLRGYSKKLRN